jgi:hypothetical protein
MARIKIGNYGQQVAPPVRQPRPDLPRRGHDTFGQSLQQAAVDIHEAELRRRGKEESEAKRIAQEAERERLQNEERARRNNMAATFARYQVNVDLLATGVGSRLTDGVVKREDAEKELESGIGDLKKKILEPLDQRSRDELENNLIIFDGRARAKFTEALQVHAKQERLDGFNASIEEFQRLALTDRPGAVRQAEILIKGEGVALLGAEKAGKVLQAFREQAAYIDLDRRITASQRDATLLAILREELAGPQSADLAPERRRFLEANIQRHEQALTLKAERDEQKRLAALERQSRRLAWYVENGHEIPAAEFNGFVAAAKGTEFEPFAQGILDEQRSVRELGRMTPAQMVAKVKELEGKYGATPTREQIIHLDKIRRFADRSIKLLNDSLITFVNERDGAAIAPLDMADLTSWGANLASRSAVLSEASKKYGVAPKGLFPQEAAAFASMLRSGSIEDRRQILATLRQGFADDAVYKATMQQIAPDAPVIAAAGLAAARGLDASRGQALASKILRGEQLLRPNRSEDGKPGAGKVLPMPNDQDMLKVWAVRSRDAFANNSEAADLFFQTARAIYAADADDAGDLSGALNGSRWESAIDEATGGFAKHNGRQVVLPHGVPYSDFRDSLRRRVDHLVAQGAVEGWTASQLMGVPLQNSGDGRYIFRVGDAVLVDKGGKRVELDFSVSPPFKPSGEAPDSAPGGKGITTKKGRSSGK